MLEWIAHRGASFLCPENTLESMQRAYEFSPNWVECDIQLTKDGVPVLFHDDDLTRVTLGKFTKTVNDYTYDELANIDVGEWFKKGVFTKVPTLSQFLATLPPTVGAMIELKDGKYSNLALVEKVLFTIQRAPSNLKLMLGSFSFEILHIVHQMAPDFPLIGIASDFPSVTKFLEAGLSNFAVDYAILTPELMKKLGAYGGKVWSFTVNELDLAYDLMGLRVQGIITDRIDNLPKLVSSGYQEISPQELNDWIQKKEVVLIDVREEEEFLIMHIPDSKLVPLSTFDPKKFVLDHDLKKAFYCRSGARSAKAAAKWLQFNPNETAYNLKGGIVAWDKLGLPVA